MNNKTIYKRNDGLRYYFQKKVEDEEQYVNSGYNLGYEFPEISCDWLEKFSSFEKYMGNYHENVNLGIAVSKDGLLTDHGPEHINSVMRHAVDIIYDPMQLTGYEIYILMCAIHFHDLGNITGRLEHEKKIGEIMSKVADDLVLSRLQREVIRTIAMAHGGYTDGDKDTIKYLLSRDAYAGAGIRPQLLASVLRFADEVSDDLNRSEFKGINIPYENRVFHDYSKSLEPISVTGNTMKLNYFISYEQTQEKTSGPSGEVYLYDEILRRLEKMMIELEYCRKYAEGMICITTLDVEIHIYDSLDNEIEKIPIRLTLQGYPDRNYVNLEYYIDKEWKRRQGVNICADGEELKKKLSNK